MELVPASQAEKRARGWVGPYTEGLKLQCAKTSLGVPIENTGSEALYQKMLILQVHKGLGTGFLESILGHSDAGSTQTSL